MAAAQGSESAVHSHTHRALALGITPEELEHAILIGVTTMGFPRMMTALSWVKDAVAAHSGR
jgi:AhpD family alkylhydroperoxidase